jgi:hypothetical protein
MIKILVAIVFAILCISSIDCAKQEFLVEKSLPNIDPALMRSNWYSGSYKVSRTREMHFLLIDSLYKKESDPVIFYLNDGPGYAAVSSALNGLGPIYFYPPQG